MNRHRLEALVQRQRCQLVFAQAMYDEVRSENIRLREIVLELRMRLFDAGLPSEVPAATLETDDQAQLELPLYAGVEQ
jgi:hypothetical protein